MGDRYEWIGPDGGVTALAVRDPKRGRGMPPIAFTLEPVPEQAGARIREVRHDVRPVDLTVLLSAADEAALRAKVRNLLVAMDPVRGDGRLRCHPANGAPARDLVCRYRQGLELEETDPEWMPVVVTFLAADPYWRDATETLVEFGAGRQFFPFFPLEVSPETTLGTSEVRNDGDVDAWPVWQVVGPGDNPSIRNDTTGEVVALTGVTLAAGETVTIDTRPGIKTVTGPGGVNLYPNLTLASTLWPLIRGPQSITVDVANTTGASRVNLLYRRRYLGV